MTPPYWKNSEILGTADEFLYKFHSTRSIPIPIETILEADLGIQIIPLLGIKERYGIEGWLSMDGAEIVVDDVTMDRFPARYNFTLAHELGHFLLHRDWLNANDVTDINS